MSNFVSMRGGEFTQGLIDLSTYVSQFGDTKTMNVLEIGSYIGESTLIFAEHFNSVLSVDPFINGYDTNDMACHAADFDSVYEKFIQNIRNHKNISHIKLTSDEAYSILLDYKFDLIYIDGNHTYEQVKKDIGNFKNLVSPGGFVAGHDYDNNWPNVIKAIHEYFTPDQIFCDFSWIKRF